MLREIGHGLKNTMSKIGEEIFVTKEGVRQGGSSSCFIFTFFVNPLIRLIKQSPVDGWLGRLHILVMMDDTVIFATTRESLENKIRKLYEYCEEYGMAINDRKTKFLGIYTQDNSPFKIGNHNIEVTNKYCYLGSLISNNTIAKQVDMEVKERQCHVRKYISFLHANKDAPYTVRKTVWDSAVMSAILYGVESWWTGSIKSATVTYMNTIKHLLDVRTQTTNDLCLLEAGIPSLQAVVRKKQLSFLNKIRMRGDYDISTIKIALDIALQYNSPMARYYNTILLPAILNNTDDPIHTDIEERREKISTSETSRALTYCRMNPKLESHPVYSDINMQNKVPDYMRRAFTKLCLQSHNLKVETGRWRHTNRNTRTCSCDDSSIQDEFHVLCICQYTANLRQQFNLDYTSLSSVVNGQPFKTVCQLILSALKIIDSKNT
jgi:hypothetical protein